MYKRQLLVAAVIPGLYAELTDINSSRKCIVNLSKNLQLDLTAKLLILVQPTLIFVLNVITIVGLRVNGIAHSKDIRVKQFSRLVIMLMAVTVVFLILNTPHYLLTAYKVMYPLGLSDSKFFLLREIFEILRTVNHSVNFLIYLAGNKTRFEAKKMFCKPCTKVK